MTDPATLPAPAPGLTPEAAALAAYTYTNAARLALLLVILGARRHPIITRDAISHAWPIEYHHLGYEKPSRHRKRINRGLAALSAADIIERLDGGRVRIVNYVELTRAARNLHRLVGQDGYSVPREHWRAKPEVPAHLEHLLLEMPDPSGPPPIVHTTGPLVVYGDPLMPAMAFCVGCNELWPCYASRTPPDVEHTAVTLDSDAGCSSAGQHQHCSADGEVWPCRYRCDHPPVRDYSGIEWRFDTDATVEQVDAASYSLGETLHCQISRSPLYGGDLDVIEGSEVNDWSPDVDTVPPALQAVWFSLYQRGHVSTPIEIVD